MSTSSSSLRTWGLKVERDTTTGIVGSISNYVGITKPAQISDGKA
ncbi:MAG: hypothetical protein ACYDCC_08445 [Actinomycetota bacterium]